MKGWTRRKVLKRGALAGISSALGLASCSKKPESAHQRTLRVYTWSDYLKPELLQKFGEEHGCRIVADTFASNEELFTALDAGLVSYDVITPSSYMASLLHRIGKLQALDASRIPNRRFMDAGYLTTAADPKMEYSVPFELSVSGLAFVPERHRPGVRSWRALDEPAVAGRFSLLDDMREVLGAALKLTGASVNATDEKEIQAAKEIAAGWIRKKRVLTSENYKASLISGEDLLVHAYSGNIATATAGKHMVEFFIPEEGVPMACDDFCVPKTATAPDLAHAFINYFCEPKVAAANMEWSGYRAPIPEAVALLPTSLKSNRVMFPDEAMLQRCEPLRDLGDGLKVWQAAWGELMAITSTPGR